MVCGDHPRAFASGLSDLQVNRYGITILYHLHLAHHKLVRSKVSNGINEYIVTQKCQ